MTSSCLRLNRIGKGDFLIFIEICQEDFKTKTEKEKESALSERAVSLGTLRGFSYNLNRPDHLYNLNGADHLYNLNGADHLYNLNTADRARKSSQIKYFFIPFKGKTWVPHMNNKTKQTKQKCVKDSHVCSNVPAVGI